jgi:predicted phosphodiesterase
MKNFHFLFVILILISCKRQEFAPTYSNAAFSHLDSLENFSVFQIIPADDKLILEEGWELHGWDTIPGKIFPNNYVSEKTNLPHRISQPNSNIWYSNNLKLSEGYLWINADDGAQLWVNGERVLQNAEMFFPIKKSNDASIEIQIRVINNAASGGLRQVFFVKREIWEKLLQDKENNFETAIQKAKEKLWLDNDYPDNWNDYPIWYSSPVLIPINKDSLMLRWTGEKNADAKLHFGHDPNMVVNTKDVVEKNGVYSVVVSVKKCNYFHFEMNKTISPLFQASISPGPTAVSFAVWADSQGGWETFSDIIKVMNSKNPQFTVGIGDLVGNGGEAWQYVKLLGHLHEVPVPHYLFPGNHDYDHSYNDWIPTHFNQNVKYQNQQNYQFWQEGPCAFIALDPNENFPVGVDLNSEQYVWFKKTISSEAWKNAPWKIIFVHQPPFSQGWLGYHGEESIQKLLKPYWESELIDVVVSGHTHDYERLITTSTNDHQTAFLILGGAGGGLEPENSKENYPQMDVLIRKHHFGWFEIDKDMLEFKAIDIEGNIIDSFVLKKEEKII